jgi:hypothetical protein
MNATFSFPLREVDGKRWCSLANMGLKRIDVVAYRVDVQQQYSFAGGHRHRLAVVRDDIHIHFPREDLTVNIQNVQPSAGPPTPPRRRHDKRGR